MVDVETRPEAKKPDKTTRSAALWAAAVAVPVAIVAGLIAFAHLPPQHDDAPPAAATTPAVVPSTPVQMAAAKLDAHTAQVCLAVTSQLPSKLRDLPGRKVSAGA